MKQKDTVSEIVKSLSEVIKPCSQISVLKDLDFQTSVKKTIINSFKSSLNQQHDSLFKSYYASVKVCKSKNCIPENIKLSEELIKCIFPQGNIPFNDLLSNQLFSYCDNQVCSICKGKNVSEITYPLILAPVLILQFPPQIKIQNLEEDINFDAILSSKSNISPLKLGSYHLVSILANNKVIMKNSLKKQWYLFDNPKSSKEFFKLPISSIEGKDIFFMYVNHSLTDISEAEIISQLQSWVSSVIN